MPNIESDDGETFTLQQDGVLAEKYPLKIGLPYTAQMGLFTGQIDEDDKDKEGNEKGKAG